jgi:hypothetical protein
MNPLVHLVQRLREEGNALVAKHPPDSEGAAVGRDRLARADEIERGLHNGWKMTVAMTILASALVFGEPLLPERRDTAMLTPGKPTISRHAVDTEPTTRSAEHTHSESDAEDLASAVAVIEARPRVAWYFGVLCAKCTAPILLFDDKSEGHPAVGFTGGGSLIVQTCPHPGCGLQRHYYGTAEVHRFTVSNGRVHLAS